MHSLGGHYLVSYAVTGKEKLFIGIVEPLALIYSQTGMIEQSQESVKINYSWIVEPFPLYLLTRKSET